MRPISIFRISVFAFLFCQVRSATAGGTVLLSEQGINNLELQTVMVEEADFEITTFALGQTEAIPESRSVLSSRIPGRVVESRLKIGATIRKGQQLVQIESRQPGNPASLIWLTAPADGTVISVNTLLGAPVEPTDRLAEFADLSAVYLIVNLPQSIAGRIRQGTQARIHFPILPDLEYTATFRDFATCPSLDRAYALGQNVSIQSERATGADLNTIGVIFTIDNPDNQLRPGLDAECSIIMDTRSGVLSVPKASLQGGAANRYVFIRHGSIPNAFDRVSVETGLISGDRVEIVDGLFPGDEVVTRGSYSLGFAGSGGGLSLKDALDAAHGHEHNEDGSEKSSDQQFASSSADGHVHDHDSHEHGILGIFFMITTGFLALLLLVVSLRRRQPANATSELS